MCDTDDSFAVYLAVATGDDARSVSEVSQPAGEQQHPQRPAGVLGRLPAHAMTGLLPG